MTNESGKPNFTYADMVRSQLEMFERETAAAQNRWNAAHIEMISDPYRGPVPRRPNNVAQQQAWEQRLCDAAVALSKAELPRVAWAIAAEEHMRALEKELSEVREQGKLVRLRVRELLNQKDCAEGLARQTMDKLRAIERNQRTLEGRLATIQKGLEEPLQTQDKPVIRRRPTMEL